VTPNAQHEKEKEEKKPQTLWIRKKGIADQFLACEVSRLTGERKKGSNRERGHIYIQDQSLGS